MKEYLLFNIYGPLASWGNVAVGEYRPTFAHPSKSSIMGIMAAALGIRREDEKVQKALPESFGFAVMVRRAGTLLRDYHTIQVPPERKGTHYLTRRSELLAADLNTILSTRDYRCDAFYVIALWMLDDAARYRLADVAEALKMPVFVPYLGRKSCPLALPFNPKILAASNLKSAFEQYPDPGLSVLENLPWEDCATIFWEKDQDSGFESQQVTIRRDMPISRRRWQFADRTEQSAVIDQGKEV
jgi:CRISPR system Cascade subunit CasD